ncbi:hypothetical protein HKD37_10G027846 [Glycine soja]
MGKVDEGQERIKADIEALKEQMATMMEVMMSMKKIMVVNVAAVAATSVVAENKHAFLPYGLPPNYTPPDVVHTHDENVNNSTPILVESQQPKSDHAHVSQPMREAHEIPHHNLANFEPRLGYAIEGQAVGGFADLVFVGERIKVGLERGKFDHPALTNKRPGVNREDEKEEGIHVVTVIPTWPKFPPAQQCHYSANISPSHYPPSNHPQRPSPNQP